MVSGIKLMHVNHLPARIMLGHIGLVDADFPSFEIAVFVVFFLFVIVEFSPGR